MKLTRIDGGQGGGLVFQFDDDGVLREWRFEPASMAEFLALLLEGGIRGGRTVELPPAAVKLVSEPGKPALLQATLPRIDLALALSDEQLAALRDAIERRLAAGKAGQQGGGKGPLQVVTGISSAPSGRKTRPR